MASSDAAHQVVDPVCGMTVDPAHAGGGSYEHAGTTYYFCGKSCREKFAADPKKWLASHDSGGPDLQVRAPVAVPPDPAEAIDPVCGMTVDPAHAGGGSYEHAGTTYYFCGKSCREKFAADPTKWLASHDPGGPDLQVRAPVACRRIQPGSSIRCAG